MPSAEGDPGTPEGRSQRTGARRFVRTRRGRLIGGVCSGLGSYFGIDPILLRIAFVGLALLGGLGLVVYLLVLLLVPEEGARRAPIRLVGLRDLSIVLGAVALIVAGGLLVDIAAHRAFGGAWVIGLGLGAVAIVGALAAALWWRLRRAPTAERESADRRLFRAFALGGAVAAGAVLIAVGGFWLAGVESAVAAWVVVALGAAMVVSAFTGGARWLVLPALAFSLPVALVIAADVDLRGGIGDRVHRPASLENLARSYRLGAGRLEVDLREVRFPAGDTSLELTLGTGQLVLIVPREVCVATSARMGAGYVGALDRETGGLDVDWSNEQAAAAGEPRLVVDAQVGVGALFVADRPLPRGGWGDRRGVRGGGFEPGTYGTNEACLGQAVDGAG